MISSGAVTGTVLVHVTTAIPVPEATIVPGAVIVFAATAKIDADVASNPCAVTTTPSCATILPLTLLSCVARSPSMLPSCAARSPSMLPSCAVRSASRSVFTPSIAAIILS